MAHLWWPVNPCKKQVALQSSPAPSTKTSPRLYLEDNGDLVSRFIKGKLGLLYGLTYRGS